MSKEKVNIICLYWVGDFRGRDFTEDDVWRLKEMIDIHIDREYDFYCLTNDSYTNTLPGRKIMLEHNFPGWWSKIELHRDDLPEGRTLYLDLDTHIVNDLQPILDYEGDLVMFKSPYHKVEKSNDKKVIIKYQAGTMLFTPGKTKEVYNKFLEMPDYYMKVYRSDQDIMGMWLPNQPTFPNKWMMKLSTLRNLSTLPEDVIIVTGQPKGIDFRRPKYARWLKDFSHCKKGDLIM